MEQLVNVKEISILSGEIESKINEYENNHKNCSGKYYTIDETNDMVDKVISKYV